MGVSPDKGAAILRAPDHQGRRLAGELLRRAGSDERSGKGLPHRAREDEAVLLGDSRARDQSRPGPAGLPVEHGHAAADHAPAAGCRTASRTSLAISSVWQDLFIKPPRGKYDAKLTRSASGWKEPDDVLEASVRPLPQERGKRAAQDLPGAERRQSRPDATAGGGDRGSSGARVQTDAARSTRFSARRPTSATRRFCSFSIRQHRQTGSRTRHCGPTLWGYCRPRWGCGRSSAARARSRTSQADAALSDILSAFGQPPQCRGISSTRAAPAWSCC